MEQVTLDDLIGGPKLRYIFDEIFSKEIQAIESEISKEDVFNCIKKSGGPRSAIFASDSLFGRIVNKQINRLREPSMKCALSVEREMKTIIKFCVNDQIEAKRFPFLMEKIGEIMMKFLAEQMGITRKLIEDCFMIELSSVNIYHPDFLIQDILKEYERAEEKYDAT